MKRVWLGSLLLWAAATQMGCNPFSMAKRGFTELRGAEGKVYVVRDAPPSFYRGLAGVTIGRVNNTIAPVCSAEMHRTLQAALTRQAEEASADMPGSGGACTVEVDVTFNKDPGGVVALIGKGALLIGRAAVFDRDAKQVADLIVVVASKAVRTGQDEMAQVFARELLGHLKKAGE